jgi:hypothetical protein
VAPARVGAQETPLDLTGTPVEGHHPSRVLVRFKPGADAERWLERRGLRTLRRHRIAELRSVAFDPGRRTLRKALRELRASGLVEYAEPDPVVRALEVIPDDPLFGQLWHLRNGGIGVDIRASQAWERSTGDPGVVVAVVDTGVDYTHPDLAGNMWTNPLEVANGVDDDGNGYVDDIHGINCIDTEAASDPTPQDRNGHGTHVAGSIAAVGNNGVGVTGVAWRASIMALRFLDARGLGFLSDAIECLDYAFDMRARGTNVRVANNSWGGLSWSSALRDAIEQAGEAGVLFVAAAGNEGENNDGNPHYPSSYALPNLVAVASTNAIDAISAFSNFGPASVHLAAPGAAILSTRPQASYGVLSGTSMSTALVSGAAALVFSRSPAASPQGVRQRLLGTVDRWPGLDTLLSSGGRLNVATALCDPGELTLGLPDLPEGTLKNLGRTRVMRAELFDCGVPVTDATIQVFFSNGDATADMRDDGVEPDERVGDGFYTGGWLAEHLGAVTARVVVTRPSGSFERIVHGVVRVVPNYREVPPLESGWVDTSAGAPSGIEGDDDFVEIATGFPFGLYTESYDMVKISSNGYLTFEGPAVDFTNDSLPNTALAPNAVIAPYWDDLDPSSGGVIRYLREGSAPERRLTVEWRDVPYYASPSRVTFQATLYEADQRIEFRYLDVESGDALRARGASATAGIEGVRGIDGHLISHDSPSLRDGDAFALAPEPPFCALGPDGDGDGLCDPDDNCPFQPNGDQSDRGGLGQAGEDGVGDSCQCGDVSANGVITATDGLAILQSLLGLDPGRFRRPELCDVGGTAECTATDGLIVNQALLALGPGIAQACPPANP